MLREDDRRQENHLGLPGTSSEDDGRLQGALVGAEFVQMFPQVLFAERLLIYAPCSKCLLPQELDIPGFVKIVVRGTSKLPLQRCCPVPLRRVVPSSITTRGIPFQSPFHFALPAPSLADEDPRGAHSSHLCRLRMERVHVPGS